VSWLRALVSYKALIGVWCDTLYVSNYEICPLQYIQYVSYKSFDVFKNPTSHASSYGIRSVLKMSDPNGKEGWLRAYQVEYKTLIDAKAFPLDTTK